VVKQIDGVLKSKGFDRQDQRCVAEIGLRVDRETERLHFIDHIRQERRLGSGCSMMNVDRFRFEEKRDQLRTIQYAGIDERSLLLSIGSVDIGVPLKKQPSDAIAIVFLVGKHG
jgi:hypothetical protein